MRKSSFEQVLCIFYKSVLNTRICRIPKDCFSLLLSNVTCSPPLSHGSSFSSGFFRSLYLHLDFLHSSLPCFFFFLLSLFWSHRQHPSLTPKVGSPSISQYLIGQSRATSRSDPQGQNTFVRHGHSCPVLLLFRDALCFI